MTESIWITVFVYKNGENKEIWDKFGSTEEQVGKKKTAKKLGRQKKKIGKKIGKKKSAINISH